MFCYSIDHCTFDLSIAVVVKSHSSSFIVHFSNPQMDNERKDGWVRLRITLLQKADVGVGVKSIFIKHVKNCSI